MADPNERQSQASVNGADAIATVSPVRDWVRRIGNELRNPVSVHGGDARDTATIFRVPISIREVAVERYIPKYFSFGLYGHDTCIDIDPSLDIYRLDFAKIFMTITEKSWDEVVAVVEVNGDSVENWVKLYGDYKSDPKLSEEDIKELLALDCVFVACFIQTYHQHVCQETGKTISAETGKAICPELKHLSQEMEKKRLTPLLHPIMVDIFKFENQIPLRLLEKYVNMMFEKTDTSGVTPDPFTKFLMDAVDLIYSDLPGPPRKQRFRPRKISEGLKNCKHLLHCLYLVVSYKPDPMEEGPVGTSESTWNRILEWLRCRPNKGDGPTSAQGQGEVELSPLPDGQTANVNLPNGQDGVVGGAPERLPGHNADVTANHPQQSNSLGGAVTAVEEPAPGAEGPAPPGTAAPNDQDVVYREAPEIQLQDHILDFRANHPQRSNGGGDDTAAEESAPGAEGPALPGTAAPNDRDFVHGEEAPDIPPRDHIVDLTANHPQVSTGDGVAEETASRVEEPAPRAVPHGTAASNHIKKRWTFVSKNRPKPHRNTTHIPTVTQLKEAGIGVAVGNTEWISEVHFKSSFFQGILYIPAFSVHRGTEELLRNLVVFEWVVERKRFLRSYVHLIKNLIDTEEDVKLMRESRVLKSNELGSDKLLANMWNEVLTGFVIQLSRHYVRVFHPLLDHYDNSFKKMAGAFFGFYFRGKPWLVLGGVIVFLTFAATLLATVYTVISNYQL